MLIALGGGEERAGARTPLWTIGGAFLVDESLRFVSRQLVEEYPIIETAGEFLESAGGPYGVTAAAAAIWLVDREAGLRAGRALLATALVTCALKIIGGRARPEGGKEVSIPPNLSDACSSARYSPDAVTQPEGSLSGARDSFPSGHSSMAFALATVVADAFPKWREEAYGIAALIALSRVLIGRHWTSDVVAGAWLGHGIASGAVSGAPIWIWQW